MSDSDKPVSHKFDPETGRIVEIEVVSIAFPVPHVWWSEQERMLYFALLRRKEKLETKNNDTHDPR